MKKCKRKGCTNPAEAYGFCGWPCESRHKLRKCKISEQDGFTLYRINDISRIMWRIYDNNNTLHYEGSNEQYANQAFQMIIEAHKQ